MMALPEPQQISLPLDDARRQYWARIGQQFTAHLAEIVESMTEKQVADGIGISKDRLSRAKKGAKRTVLHPEWIPFLLAAALNDEALAFLASLRGKRLEVARRLTPEEENERMRGAAMELLGSELYRQLLKRAFSK